MHIECTFELIEHLLGLVEGGLLVTINGELLKSVDFDEDGINVNILDFNGNLNFNVSLNETINVGVYKQHKKECKLIKDF